MSGANASPIGRSHQGMSGANASPTRSASATARSLKKGRSHQGMSGAIVAVLGLVMSAVMAAPGLAHHSGAMFEREKTITVEGVVKEFQYTNPHSWLLVDVKHKDGSVTTWGFEAEGPSTLQRSGIRRSDFAPGTKLKITGHPMKDGTPAAVWVEAVRADGKRFDPREGFKVK